MSETNILDVPFSEVFHEWEARTDSFQDIAAVRAFALYDRYFLLVQILGRKDCIHPWIYARCREVEKSPDGHLDLWARDHYKSSVITFAGVIQENMKDPELPVGIFSHTKGIAKAFLRQIKNEYEGNERLRGLFPDIIWESPDKEAPLWSIDHGIILRRKSNPKEASIEAWGLVDGMPTSKHFGLLVYDDVVVKDSVSTPEQIAKTTEMWELSDNLGTSEVRKWHIGTRYSYADTYGVMIERGSVIPRLYAATDDGTLEGKPVLLSQEVWDRKKRDQGEATISCQMLQNPLAGQQRMFNVADLGLYEVRPETLNVYILIDPARSKKPGSANTAMAVLGLDYAGNKYLLDGFNHKMDLMERWQRMSQLWVKWTSQIGIQNVAVGYESFGAQADMQYFEEQKMLTRMHFEITELAWPRDGEGSKVDRVQRLTPDIRNHKFWLPYNTDEKILTTNQRKMLGGYEYRIAKPIRRVDENSNIYDMSEQFRLQVHFFPFGRLRDLIDAVSRIYDMEPRAPSTREPRYAEPMYV